MESSQGKKYRYINVMPVGDVADQWAEKVVLDAIVFPNERITYPQLAERSTLYAKALLGIGVGPRDKVGILIHGCIDYFTLFIGICKAGAVAVPINARFKQRELRHVVNESDMKVLITSSDAKDFINYAELVSSIEPDKIEKLQHIICFSGETPKGFMPWSDFLAAAEAVSDDQLVSRREKVRVRDACCLMFTSGTTAMPKAAIISHEALYRAALVFALDRCELKPGDVFWTPLVMYHIGGIAYTLMCLTVGATFCHNGPFNPEVAIKQLVEEKVTTLLPSFDATWLPVVNHPDFPKADLSRMRYMVMTGTRERLEQLQKLYPHCPSSNSFGLTEVSGWLSVGRADDPLEKRLTTGGKLVPGMEVRIVDMDTGKDLGPNQVGEVLMRGAHLFDGYYNQPEVTKRAIDEDGWFHSGDLGTLDEKGYLTYRGRSKDMLKVGGENVAALEVEGYLLTHPAVLISQVVAAPDARYSEVPAAFIQLKPGATATEQEIIQFCLGKIATFKVPRYVRFVQEWPMSGTKIQKFVLRDQIIDELKKAGITEAPKLKTS